MIKKRFLRKGQLTLFFIIGIFMIAVFAFMWYLNTRVAEQQLAAPTEKIISDLLKTGSIPYYVGLCLEKNADDGLVLAGQQGGDIYTDEDGPAPNPNKYLPLDYRVTYGISKPFLQNGTIYPEPPGYPGGDSRMKQVPSLEFNHEGRFGEVSLRRLCDPYGANSPLAQYSLGVAGANASKIMHVFCQAPFIYSDTLSTQWQMQEYIKKKIVNCTNWTAIKEETGYNVTATGAPNITFRLGTEDTWVDAYIPLRIEVGGREPVYVVGDFHIRIPVRLKRIVELASYLATYDSYRLSFNLSKEYGYYFSDIYDSNMMLRVDTPLLMLGIWDDVITIEDTASKIRGENYIYRFARENRYPALDLISTLNNFSDYDIVVMEGDKIFLNPNPPSWETPDGNKLEVIYDPDEDNLTYYYTGWKETCDETFDFDRGIPRTLCSAQEPTHPSNFFVFPNQGAQPDWPGMPAWKELLRNIANFPSATTAEQYPEDAPLNWTTSQDYTNSGRNASYTTNHDDIGPHNITIWVCDEAGLCDYQIVRIRVIDYPILHLDGKNPYSDTDLYIRNDTASVEDLYRLDGSGSTYYMPLLKMIFGDPLEPFEITVEADPADPNRITKVVMLPQPPPDNVGDIRYIPDYIFNRTRHCILGGCVSDKVSVLHEINLTVPYINAIPAKFNATVYQCLPHRNPGHYSWPYNDTNDVYKMDHTCCSMGGSFNTTIRVSGDTANPAISHDLVGNVFSMFNEYKSELGTVTLYDANGNPLCTLSASDTILVCGDYQLSWNENEVNATFLAVPPLPGIYYLEQEATDMTQYLPWGAWREQSETCYAPQPVMGSLPQLEKSTEDVDQTFLKPTETYIGGLDMNTLSEDDYQKWRNDVIIMSFRRQCSGDRGNICSGKAFRDFVSVDACKDMNTTIEEVESCRGPKVDLLTPQTLVPMGIDCTTGGDASCNSGEVQGKCIDDNCYNPNPNTECDKYSDDTFEHLFSLNRTTQPTVAANTRCNEQATCSDSSDKYDVRINEGRYLLNWATCNNGECSKALPQEGNDWYDCSDYNGLSNRYDPNSFFCKLKSDHLWSVNWTCKEPETGADCAMKNADADPDSDINLCNACQAARIPNIYNAMSNTWNIQPAGKGRELYCCGDDPGEGGYPYNGQTNAVVNPGKWEKLNRETVCNDISTVGLTDIEIDNDCNGWANCKDSNCKSKLGPVRSYCCLQSTDCRSGISLLFESVQEGLGCDDNNECDCKKIEKGVVNPSADDTYNNWYRELPYDTIKTCVASYTNAGGFKDRFIKITNLPPGTYTFNIQSTELNGNPGDCAILGKVKFHLYKNSQNTDETGGGSSQIEVSIGANDYLVISFTNLVLTKDCISTVSII
jgi:hypothetical protein